jgi:hypothetical protein
MGAFTKADPTSPKMDKGYRLRDTDDRLHRMKTQAAKHRSDFVHVNGVVGSNGKFRDMLGIFLSISIINQIPNKFWVICHSYKELLPNHS